ncbi:MAG: hypothetical protein ACK5KM_04845, partial [Hyphomicrobiaceae bacterium]
WSWGGWYVAKSMGGAMTSRLPAGQSSGSDRFLEDEIEEAFTWNRGAGSGRDDFGQFYPGEPIAAPPRRRGSSMRSATLVILVLSGIGWGLWKTDAYWRPLASVLTSEVMAALERSGASATGLSSSPQPSDPLTGDAAAGPLSTIPPSGEDVASAHGAFAGTPVEAQGDADGPAAGLEAEASDEKDAAADPASDEPAPEKKAASPETETPEQPAASAAVEKLNTSSKTSKTEEVVPLPPLQVDPKDPYQKRALAAGLHPDLSRVLLQRMSSTDYRNAREAVRKALNNAADDATFVWPRQRVPKQALFKVHFVAGAPSDCRRYVVTITKDGWSTTAQPMERCGFKRTAARSSS